MTGRLDIVGLGPGGPEHRTAAAAAAVRAAEVVDRLRPLRRPVRRPARTARRSCAARWARRRARADEALRRAAAGARVALVSSGDAGVHGMAARTLARAAELAEDERPAIEVIPGVTAALAAGALLGAPLGDDFAALSLSDLHVAWEVVERRLTAVAAAGLALALYNPRSRTRTWQLERVLEVLREHRDARHAGRGRDRRRAPGPARRARDAGDARPRDGDDALAARRRRRQRPPRGPSGSSPSAARGCSRDGHARRRRPGRSRPAHRRGPRRARARRRRRLRPPVARRGRRAGAGRTRSATASAWRPGSARCRRPRSTRCSSSSGAATTRSCA